MSVEVLEIAGVSLETSPKPPRAADRISHVIQGQAEMYLCRGNYEI